MVHKQSEWGRLSHYSFKPESNRTSLLSEKRFYAEPVANPVIRGEFTFTGREQIKRLPYEHEFEINS